MSEEIPSLPPVEAQRQLMDEVRRRIGRDNTWAHEALDELEAVIAAIPSPQTWQSIETAPKDGTWLFVYSPSVKVAFYPTVAFWDDNGWTSPAYEDGEIGFSPTHWMPLPSPPVASPRGGPAKE